MRLSAKMDRTDGGTPWGFRMTGGKDFGAPLVVQRVSHDHEHDFSVSSQFVTHIERFGDDWRFMGAIGLHAKLSANVISINRS